MTLVIKPLSNTAVVNSTPSFSGARLVWVYNTGATNANVAIRDTANAVMFFWVPANTDVIVEKGLTDTLESNNNSTIFGTKVAYRN